MDVQKIAAKIFVAHTELKSVDFVPVFHRWIQNASFADHLLIDVADYAHVDAGPGAVLVSDQANIHMDDDQHELGLLYIRKRPLEGDLSSRIKQIARYAMQAALQIEADPQLAGKVRFSTSRLAIHFNDRGLAPNTPETVQQLHTLINQLAGQLWPHDQVQVVAETDPQLLAGFNLVGTDGLDLTAWIARLA